MHINRKEASSTADVLLMRLCQDFADEHADFSADRLSLKPINISFKKTGLL